MTYQNYSGRISQLRILNRQIQYIKSVIMTLDGILPDEEKWADDHGHRTENEALVEALNKLRLDLVELDLNTVIMAIDANLYPAARRTA